MRAEQRCCNTSNMLALKASSKCRWALVFTTHPSDSHASWSWQHACMQCCRESTTPYSVQAKLNEMHNRNGRIAASKKSCSQCVNKIAIALSQHLHVNINMTKLKIWEQKLCIVFEAWLRFKQRQLRSKKQSWMLEHQQKNCTYVSHSANPDSDMTQFSIFLPQHRLPYWWHLHGWPILHSTECNHGRCHDYIACS